MPLHDENVSKLRELMKDIQVAMMTTIEADGSLRSRPMQLQEAEFDGSLWFLTDAKTAKVYEIERDHHVNLSFSHPTKANYVSVSGLARLVRDRAKAEELWTPLHKAWFPQGLDDPNLALLRVDIQKAEYWDSPSSKVVQLIGFVKAIATGKPYGEEATDHEKLNLKK
jgi:general stress protein 26